jgi:hypothetical protein
MPATPPPICQSFAPVWLPHCLLWHLRLTSASSPSPLPPPPPLVASCFCPPQLDVVLSPVNLQLCDHHPPLPLPPMVGCCIFCLLHRLSLLLHGLSSCCAIASRSASRASRTAGCCITSLSSSWLLHHHSSHRHLPSVGASTSHRTIFPLIMPLSMPLPPVPLVRLVVASHLLTFLLLTSEPVATSARDDDCSRHCCRAAVIVIIIFVSTAQLTCWHRHHCRHLP